MVPPSQGRRSTNWKSAEAGSKRQTRMSEIAKVMRVVHSATHRALRAPVSSSRSRAMNSAPASGRKVTTERIGQLASVRSREHEPGDGGGNADQHGEGVVIEIAGLQPHDAAGHVEHAGGHPVRAEPVDNEPVAALPQEPAEPKRRANKEEIVDAVEVPSIEQEVVEHTLLACQPFGNIRAADVELEGH